jgi:hypothetical protein
MVAETSPFLQTIDHSALPCDSQLAESDCICLNWHPTLESNPPRPVRVLKFPLFVPLTKFLEEGRIWKDGNPDGLRFIGEMNDVGGMVLFFDGYVIIRTFPNSSDHLQHVCEIRGWRMGDDFCSRIRQGVEQLL